MGARKVELTRSRIDLQVKKGVPEMYSSILEKLKEGRRELKGDDGRSKEEEEELSSDQEVPLSPSTGTGPLLGKLNSGFSSRRKRCSYLLLHKKEGESSKK